MFKCKTKNLHKRIGLTERVVCLYIRMCIAWKQWLQNTYPNISCLQRMSIE